MSTEIPAADRIADAVYSHFAQLPKAGKPADNEWTVLSAVLQYTAAEDRLQVVSLGTGTKCLSRDQLSDNGVRLNDSHAEVMARRGFVRYLYHQLHLTKQPDFGDETGNQRVIETNSIFTYDSLSRLFALSDRVTFHFFSSHPPCGDASIFEREPQAIVQAEGLVVDGRDDADEPSIKRRKTEQPAPASPLSDEKDKLGDIVRGFTGGKLVEQPSAVDDDTAVDTMAQTIGAIRTKPGRGVRTDSVSCSDKLSRWCYLGLEGVLIGALLLTDGICVASFTIAGECSVAALQRAIWGRWQADAEANGVEMQVKPVLQRTSVDRNFKWEQRADCSPSPSSVVWCRVPTREFEVAVSGYRQGVTKKNMQNCGGHLKICKRELFRQYHRLVFMDYPKIGADFEFDEYSTTYQECKQRSIDDRNLFELLKTRVFKCWTQKSIEIDDFVL